MLHNEQVLDLVLFSTEIFAFFEMHHRPKKTQALFDEISFLGKTLACLKILPNAHARA